MVIRAKIVLAAAKGQTNAAIAADLGMHIDTVRKWRRRFCQHGIDGRGDRPRSGRPARFTPVQVAEVKALACTPPADVSVPLARWSAAELAGGAVPQGLVETISPATVSRSASGTASAFVTLSGGLVQETEPLHDNRLVFAQLPVRAPASARTSAVTSHQYASWSRRQWAGVGEALALILGDVITHQRQGRDGDPGGLHQPVPATLVVHQHQPLTHPRQRLPGLILDRQRRRRRLLPSQHRRQQPISQSAIAVVAEAHCAHHALSLAG
jgi:hypothetical protein